MESETVFLDRRCQFVIDDNLIHGPDFVLLPKTFLRVSFGRKKLIELQSGRKERESSAKYYDLCIR